MTTQKSNPAVARHRGWINLGSAFLVEDWLCTSVSDEERAKYDQGRWRWHMSSMAKEVMERHLEERISRENFQAMSDYGVGIVRVPVGYWNFLSASQLEIMTMGHESSPVAAEDLQLMRRLHELMTPAEYSVHLRRLFRLAIEFDMRVLLDLHGLPGSQNGESSRGVWIPSCVLLLTAAVGCCWLLTAAGCCCWLLAAGCCCWLTAVG